MPFTFFFFFFFIGNIFMPFTFNECYSEEKKNIQRRLRFFMRNKQLL